jgi:hypothetical protein
MISRQGDMPSEGRPAVLPQFTYAAVALEPPFTVLILPDVKCPVVPHPLGDLCCRPVLHCQMALDPFLADVVQGAQQEAEERAEYRDREKDAAKCLHRSTSTCVILGTRKMPKYHNAFRLRAVFGRASIAKSSP